MQPDDARCVRDCHHCKIECYKERMYAHVVAWIILLTGVYPIAGAWLANRQTSLLHAVYWLLLTWLGWLAALARDTGHPAHELGTYVALCLTGCAGMAVLGARRPGATAWNFVVLALLAINLLPLAEGLLTGKTLQLGGLRAVCIAGTIAVGILNYLPTRLGPASLLLFAGAGLEFAVLLHALDKPAADLGGYLVAFFTWVAGASLGSQPLAASQFDRLWLDFRNRFGFVWAQRLRDQFNRSAANNRWPVVLRWQGLRLLPGTTVPEEPDQEEMLATLRALMKRFGPEEKSDA
jgi:hypothetical protein